MIELTYSNRTEELLAALVEAMRAERARLGPFEPLRLVVPNRNVETYVKHGLAEALGIAANLEVTFLERLADRLCHRVLPGAALAIAPRIEAHLLALLHDEAFLAAPVLAPVREYLAAATPAAVDRRRTGLAAELARLYDEYAASRPELLAAWRERATLASGVAAGIEAWQRALWLGIFGPGGRGTRKDEALLLLSDVARAVEGGGAPARASGVHVFGLSYMARGYHHLLAALARSTDVRLYTLNPCREFWEDVDSVPELRKRVRREGRQNDFPTRDAGRRQPTLGLGADPYGLEGERENLALRLWGRPGRENIRLLNDRTAGDFVGRFVVNQGKNTLLARLQDDILDRVSPGAPDPSLRADHSLAVLPCPGVRRELEVVAAEIWRAIDADPTLRFNQIAVVIPEAVKDTYLPSAGAVFGEAHELPHTLVDLPFGRGGRIGEALLLLLELPFGGFTRRELLPLLTHPALMGRFPEARPVEWLRLAEDLGIVHGADHADHAGTYIQRDVLNWDQGVRRVALGALCDTTAAEPPAVELGGQEYLPLPRGSDERKSALEFCLLVRSLIADARFAAGVTGPRLRPLSQWCEFVRGLAAAYLVPDGADDEAVLAECLAELEAIEARPFGPTPISFRVAADLVRAALAGVTGARGQYLAHGVTVTSFVPMRAVPFRHVFVVGLGERSFPSPNRRSELDLRAVTPHVGDVSPRQRDLYMFLETLLGTRDRLVLSYVARDELTGAALAPSSLLRELREVVAGYLPPAEVTALFEPAAPPLRRYDDEARSPLSALAAREAQAKALGRSLRAALPAGVATPDLAELRQGLAPALFGALAARLEAHAPPTVARRERGKALVVPLEALRRFLEDPLQGSARFRLRMRETVGDEEIIDREDEPWQSDRLQRAMVLREAMLDAIFATRGLPDDGALAAAFARRARAAELRGVGPTGLFAAAEAPAQLAVLKGWRAGLERLAPGAVSYLRFGRPASRSGHPVRAEAPIRLEIPAPPGHGGAPLAIEIVGRTELCTGEPIAGSLVFASRRDNSPVRVFRDRLRVFVDHVALAAAGQGAGQAHAVSVIWSDGDGFATSTARFAPVTPDAARAYLGRLIADLVSGANTGAGVASGLHPYLLPHEAVHVARTRGTALTDEVEKLRDYYFERPVQTFSTVNGPVPQAVERHDPPPAAEADAMVEARFGLIYELLREDKA